MKKKIDQLVLLNGGLGKRVKSISKNKPKCLINFGNKSFLHRQLLLFKKKGIKKIVICTGYKSRLIDLEIKKIKIKNLDIKILEEKVPLGTGGAIKNIQKYLDDYFFVTYGDSWININFNNLISNFYKKRENNMICIINKSRIFNHKPNILINKNRIKDYKKDEINFNYIDYGLMIFSVKGIKKLKKNKFDLSYYVKKLIKNKSLSIYKVKKKFYEIGSLQGIRDFKKIILL